MTPKNRAIFKYQNSKDICMAQTPVIGVLGAVVAAGLGYYYFTQREEATETTETVVSGGIVTPEETTEVVEETSALDSFTKKAGSLYPAFGGSDLQKPDARKSIVGSEACAQACKDDPNCVAFTHWTERYTSDFPEGGTELHPDTDLCYFWSGPQGDDTTIAADAAVGPAHEGNTDDAERAKSVAHTYIKIVEEPEEETQTNEAEQVAHDYTPLDYRPLSDSIQFDPRSKAGNCF